MQNPFIFIISQIISIYTIVLLVWVIMSWLISFNIINRHQPFVYRVNDVLNRLVEPALKPIRRFMPDLGGVDISPIILILLLQFLERAMLYYL
ncbi:MAG: YggT family protein [Alphaproteobacteria bacterium]|nr:YggT family protein [Alphaproteobacteria bacterium]